MSDARTRLAQLGLAVEESADGPRVHLDLGQRPLTHPLTRAPIATVTFSVHEGQLASVAPAPLRGLVQVGLQTLAGAGALATTVREAFARYVARLERASAQLQALGLEAEVDATTLELKAQVAAAPWSFTVVQDIEGRFHLVAAWHSGQAVEVQGRPSFTLEDFGDRGTLSGYLAELVGAGAGETRAEVPLVRYGELEQAFGAGALVPPHSPLELVVELEVGSRRYRFAAARVAGRTFRGLLAGSRGKLWAERFTLDDFPGVVPLLAQVLGVPQESVRVAGSTEE